MDKEEQRIREHSIYEQYQSVIAYFIVEWEVREVKYPTEILNEIRSIFTHLSRYKIQNSEKDLISAERHVKRAILDCYKYMCISYADEISEFRYTYRKVDLKIADNGKFLPTLDRLENEAKEAYLTAKKSEIKNTDTENEIYFLYETAYNTYKKLSDFLKASNEAILFASSHSKRSNYFNIAATIITIISIAITIITIIK